MKQVIEGWAARDKDNDGFLTCFNRKPIRAPKRFLRKQRKVWICSKECTSWVGIPRNLFPDLKWEDEPIKVKITYETIDTEQPEYSYLEEFDPIYHCGKKPTWKVGDTLAYYILTTDEEGECVYGTVTEVHFDEEYKDWRYQLKDYPSYMNNDGIIYEEELICSEAYKV